MGRPVYRLKADLWQNAGGTGQSVGLKFEADPVAIRADLLYAYCKAWGRGFHAILPSRHARTTVDRFIKNASP